MTPGERPMSAARPPLLVIAGPTASGKSSLALALALRFGGEIISCDSVAVYREFEIGTAKPARRRARQRPAPPHRRRLPRRLVHRRRVRPPGAQPPPREITARGRLPIVCGGTGLYLRAMLDGLFDGPERDEDLRQRLRHRRRPAALWRLLRRLDPESAARIHPNDEPKLIRAIEVCAAAARPMSQLLRQGRDPIQGYRILRIGLSPQRAALYERINQRCAHMFEQGLVEETRDLLARYGPEVFAMRSLGYRQAAEHLRGECSLAEAVAAAQQGHRNYAKRQLTWFRRDTEMHWLEDFGPAVATRAEDIRARLPRPAPLEQFQGSDTQRRASAAGAAIRLARTCRKPLLRTLPSVNSALRSSPAVRESLCNGAHPENNFQQARKKRIAPSRIDRPAKAAPHRRVVLQPQRARHGRPHRRRIRLRRDRPRLPRSARC